MTTGSAPNGVNAAATTACAAGVRTNFNATLNGVVTAAAGSQWTVPAAVNTGDTAIDIFNDCIGTGDNPNAESQLKTVVIDEDGVEITGYIFADNYFELYVNGQFVARDSIAFTPFNASVVRFKASYPLTYALKLVDWETHLGLGMEYDEYKVGDGGFIAQFSDGTVTNANWKVQPFYLAPLDDPSCVSGRDSSACPTRPACADRNPESCQALHYPVPDNWMMPDFDDSNWPAATLWRAEDVTNQPAYTNYTDRFSAASFIWSRNLLLDNLVLGRVTVNAPAK